MNAKDIIIEATQAAVAAMDAALTKYRADVKARGQEAWDRQVKACGTEKIEPLYCGFAWVIVPRKDNPDFIKAIKALGAGAGGIDFGSATGYAKKGECTATDWQFWSPGKYHGQSMDIKEVGAYAFRDVLAKHGLKNVIARSRAD